MVMTRFGFGISTRLKDKRDTPRYNQNNCWRAHHVKVKRAHHVKNLLFTWGSLSSGFGHIATHAYYALPLRATRDSQACPNTTGSWRPDVPQMAFPPRTGLKVQRHKSGFAGHGGSDLDPVYGMLRCSRLCLDPCWLQVPPCLVPFQGDIKAPLLILTIC